MFSKESSSQSKVDPGTKPTPPIARESWLKKLSQKLFKSDKKTKPLENKPVAPAKDSLRHDEKKGLDDQRHVYNQIFSKVDSKEPVTTVTPPPAPKNTSSDIFSPHPTHPVTPSAKPLTPPPPSLHSQTKEEILNTPVDPPDMSSATLPPASPMFSGSLFRRKAKSPLNSDEQIKLDARNAVEKRSFEPSRAVKPNLIKNQEILFFNWHEHALVFGLSVVMCCLVISLVYVSLLIWQKERMDNNKVTLLNVKAIDEQIIKTEKEVREIKDFNGKLISLSTLLDNHIYWTNYFSFLEDATLKDVYLKSFVGDISGEYTIPALARNLDAVSSQLEVMKSYSKVKSITPETGSPNEVDKTIPFSLGMSIDPLIFTK